MATASNHHAARADECLNDCLSTVYKSCARKRRCGICPGIALSPPPYTAWLDLRRFVSYCKSGNDVVRRATVRERHAPLDQTPAASRCASGRHFRLQPGSLDRRVGSMLRGGIRLRLPGYAAESF